MEDDNREDYEEMGVPHGCWVVSRSFTASSATAATRKSDRCGRNNQNKVRDPERVALDCEMVGVGRSGRRLILARVSMVDKTGKVLLDAYVKPNQPVTDYKTDISGIRPSDLENAELYYDVRQKVVDLLAGKILVGHGVNHDLKQLQIVHPSQFTRDTAFYAPLKECYGNGTSPSLKGLAKKLLNRDIQTGEHDSVEDARAAMEIYNMLCDEWEEWEEC